MTGLADELRDVVHNKKTAWQPQENTTVGKIMLQAADELDRLEARVRELESALGDYKEPLTGKILSHREVYEAGYREGDYQAFKNGYHAALKNEGLTVAMGEEDGSRVLVEQEQRIAELEAEASRFALLRNVSVTVVHCAFTGCVKDFAVAHNSNELEPTVYCDHHAESSL